MHAGSHLSLGTCVRACVRASIKRVCVRVCNGVRVWSACVCLRARASTDCEMTMSFGVGVTNVTRSCRRGAAAHLATGE